MFLSLYRFLIVALALSCLPLLALAQHEAKGASSDNHGSAHKVILPHVRAWHMIDDMTLADTITVDTIVAEHQVHNPIWRKSVSCVTLGNLGSPAIATFYPAFDRSHGNVFFNSLMLLMTGQEDFVFYNTLTPYANLTYQKGIPKRVAEEFFSVLFTQNVNRRLNVGMKLDINSAIGRYENQNAFNRKFLMWSSFDGDVYHYNFHASYQRFLIHENGGVVDDDVVLHPDLYDYDDAQDIPVQFMDSRNRLALYRLLFNNRVDLGSVTRTEGDSVEYDVPIASAFYKLFLENSDHNFRIDNLAKYDNVADKLFPDILLDPNRTRDNRRYSLISNVFQLMLNEEFNSLLHFGLRGYISNEVRKYKWDDISTLLYDPEMDSYSLVYHKQQKHRVTSYIGGQIFKNTGSRIFWNAGLKFCFQGAEAGDVDANGKLLLRVGQGAWATRLWAEARFALRSPSVWEEKFCSNHYAWSNNFNREQNFDVKAGLDIPGVGLQVSAFSATLHDRIFFGSDGTPAQASDVVQVVGVAARQHFVGKRSGLNSIIRLAVQKTSDNDVVPAPAFALYSTNFWEHKFFGVLLTQIGFDVRFNSRFFSPSYVPAIMQFVPQHERKTGGYGYFDPFLNFHLRKIRAYLKYEHVNYLWGSHDAFHTIHYPANPATVKFGLSWNFYD